MMDLRIVRGPLKPRENEVILSEYNRLTSSNISMEDFLRWVQASPAGPCFHAILETDDARIVGHSALIPLRAHSRGKWLVPAKSEYGFILEEFRTVKIRGFEHLPRPRQIILLDQLFQHCHSAGLGPFLISGSRALQRFGPRAQCYRVDFPLWECLLILRPWMAARRTPNLKAVQNSLLGLIGVPQSLAWRAFSAFPAQSNGVRPVPIDDIVSPDPEGGLTFFDDQESLRWRYPSGQYERLALDGNGKEYVIVKKGSPGNYLRVCQWKLSSDKQVTYGLITRLVQMALREKAMGVRWAVYGNNEFANKTAKRMRGFGFLTAKRIRTLLIQSKEQPFLDPEKWNLNDAMFSFDF